MQNPRTIINNKPYRHFGAFSNKCTKGKKSHLKSDTITYLFGFNGKEKDDETYGSGNAYDFGARIYEARLGMWFSIDPLCVKYPSLSPYIFCGNNPILFVDIDGRDWFVNNKTGQVIYIKNASQMSTELVYATGTGESPNDYERLGPNDMFGKKLNDAYGNDMLKRSMVIVEASDIFMKKQGYEMAEKVNIREREFFVGGAVSFEENIPHTYATIEQIGESKTTYVKPEKLNTKANVKETIAKGPKSTITTLTYGLTKPFGQDNRTTASFSQNVPSTSLLGLAKQVAVTLTDFVLGKSKIDGHKAPIQPQQQKPAGK